MRRSAKMKEDLLYYEEAMVIESIVPSQKDRENRTRMTQIKRMNTDFISRPLA